MAFNFQKIRLRLRMLKLLDVIKKFSATIFLVIISGQLIVFCQANTSRKDSGTLLKPVTVFKYNQLRDMTSDGRFLLFFQTKIPVRTYTVPLNGSPNFVDQPPVNGDVLRVLERESGHEIALHPVDSYPSNVKFIPSTQQVFYQERAKTEPFSYNFKLWNYASGQVKTCIANSVESFSEIVFPDMNNVLGVVFNKDRYLGHLLAKIDVSDCTINIIGGIYPSKDSNDQAHNRLLSIAISANHRLLAYPLIGGQIIVVRNINDQIISNELKVQGLFFRKNLTFTPDGKFLLSVAGDKPFQTGSKEYLLVYDTETFKEIQRFIIHPSFIPKLANDMRSFAVAVSPDSKMIAVSYETIERSTLNKFEEPRVALYNLKTGENIGEISHPQLKESRNNFDQSEINKISFTPDGKYLLTSAYDTYVWDISKL